MCSSILVTQDWSIFYGFTFNKDYSTQTYICAHLHFTLNICCLTLIPTVWLQTFCGTFIMSFYCLLPSSYCTSSLVSSLIYLTAAKAQRLSAVKAGSDTSPLKVKVKHQCGRRTLNLRFESASDSTGKAAWLSLLSRFPWEREKDSRNSWRRKRQVCHWGEEKHLCFKSLSIPSAS